MPNYEAGQILETCRFNQRNTDRRFQVVTNPDKVEEIEEAGGAP